jgi:hypothetical protein
MIVAGAFFLLAIMNNCQNKSQSTISQAPNYSTQPTVPAAPPVSVPNKPRYGYISIFYNQTRHTYAWANGHQTAESAKVAAKNVCEENFGVCEEWATRHNKCFSVYRHYDKRNLRIGFGNSWTEAANDADKKCSENGKYICIPDGEKSSACDSWP